MGHVFVKATLEGIDHEEDVNMLVDTGATLSSIPKELAQRTLEPTRNFILRL